VSSLIQISARSATINKLKGAIKGLLLTVTKGNVFVHGDCKYADFALKSPRVYFVK